MRDAVLVFPPAYYPWFVPAGLSYLTAYARQAGFSVEQRDANIPAIEYLLAPRQLRQAGAPETLITRVSQALKTMRQTSSHRDFWSYRDAKCAIEEAAGLINDGTLDTFRIFRNTFQYISQFDARKREGIIQAVEHRTENVFYDYFAQVEVPAIVSQQPRLVGLSINDHHQLIPAFVLASLLKDVMPATHVCFGGNLIARVLNTLEQTDTIGRQLFGVVDSFIHHEGEQPLVALLRELRGHPNPDQQVPQLLRRTGDAIVNGPRSQLLALTELPLPDPKPYHPWTPDPVISLNVYRGCYHSGVCTFCDINEGYDSVRHHRRTDGRSVVKFAKRLRPMAVVADDMVTLSKQFGTRTFSFTDEWFRVQEMLELGTHLERHGLQFSWEAYARFERAYLDQRKCHAARAAGARFLQFGLESISPQTLKQMRKGNTPGEYALILANTTRAGIWNHVFFIVGYPGEPAHHTLSLFAFLTRHARNVLTIKPTRFQLARRAPLVHRPPEDIVVAPEHEWDLHVNIPFHYQQHWWCPTCKGAIEAAQITFKRHRGKCGRCGSYLDRWFLQSRKVVDGIYVLSEILCERHWAHPVTSVYPYVSRLFLTVEDVERMSRDAPRCQVISPNDEMGALTKVRSALAREVEMVSGIADIYASSGLTLPSRFASYDHFLEFCFAWEDAAGRSADSPGTRDWSVATATLPSAA